MPSWSPAYPAFSLLACPHPPNPLPGGKGGDYKFILPGAPPPAPRHQTVYGTDRHCHRCTLWGACPLGRWFALPPRYPTGGMPSLSPAYPAFSLLACPHPPSPLPGGKGGDYKFILPGAPPPAPRHQTVYGTDRHCHRCTLWGACPLGRWFALPPRYPTGGMPSLSPAYPAFNLLSRPHPPNPLPSGKGETISLFCRGLRPRRPGIRPLTALTATATMVPDGGLALLVAGSPCRHGTLWGGLPSLSLAYPAFSLFVCPIPLTPLPTVGKFTNCPDFCHVPVIYL